MADYAAGEHEPEHQHEHEREREHAVDNKVENEKKNGNEEENTNEEENDSSFVESVKGKITETFPVDDSLLLSSDDEGDKGSPVSAVKHRIYRLFGRQKPIHKVLGGGKPADILLWRDKKISAGVLGLVTSIWVLFELMEYHLISLICHILILVVAMFFVWSNASDFINKSAPQFPAVSLPEEVVLGVASGVRIEINGALALFRKIAAGKELKKFLTVIAILWVVSIVGSYCNFLTLLYICFLFLHSVPKLYEKYEDQVDAFGEKAEAEIKKQFEVFRVKVLNKVPIGSLKDKKFA